MNIKTIAAIERDGMDVRVLTMTMEILTDEGNDLKQAVRKACSEYLRTISGIDVYHANCECFNWGDFVQEVPNEICEKYGFRKVQDAISDEYVDWDEQLVDGLDDSVDALEEILEISLDCIRDQIGGDDISFNYAEWRETLFVEFQKIFDKMKCSAASQETIYTRDWAATMLEVLESKLSEENIILSGHDGDSKDDGTRICGDYYELLDDVETSLDEWMQNNYPENYISYEFSGN